MAETMELHGRFCADGLQDLDEGLFKALFKLQSCVTDPHKSPEIGKLPEHPNSVAAATGREMCLLC
jgi:hypothetical protein